MRARLALGRTLFFAAALLFALIALLPLRLAADWLGLAGHGFAAREARGSMWMGAFEEARLGPVPLGDVTARLNSLPLLLGRARVSLERDDGGKILQGAATVTRGGFGFDDLTAELPVGAVFAPLPISSLDLSDVTAHFSEGQCARAEGRVRATASGPIGGIALPSGLGGNVRCDGRALLLPLAGQSGMERMNLRLFADGRYRADLVVRPADDAARDRLIANGFRLGRGGYALSAEGRF